MTTLRSLYDKFEHLVHEFTKFGIVGGIAFVVNAVVLNLLLHEFPSKVIVATIVSAAVATVVTYVGNRYWTYKDRDSIGRHREMALFFVVNGVATAIQAVCVAIAHYGFGFQSVLATNVANYVFGLPLGMVFRLWTYRTFIFPKTAGAEGQPRRPAAERV